MNRIKATAHRSRCLAFLLGLGLALALSRFTPLGLVFDHSALVMKLHMAGHWGMAMFILAHVFATALGLPGAVLVVAGGAVFGLFWGSIASVVGATLGAIAAFYIARCLMRDWVEQRFGHHSALKKLNQMVRGNRLNCVLSVRFTPISPFNLVNFLFGLTTIDLKSYALGTLLGIIPGTIAYTWLGASGSRALRGEGFVQLLLALSLLALLSLMPVILKARRG
jgi:uncharacterized membrane protein YdjX (TVP38/TMEM64 family)